MFKQHQKRGINIIYTLCILILLWISISSSIQRFACPQMTETELFIHIPHSFIGAWEYC